MSRRKLLIEHPVKGQLKPIFESFTRELFEALTPKFPPVKLERYDGSEVGDLVKIRMGIWPVHFQWISEITDRSVGNKEAYFVDTGVKLPPPLNYWRHKHLLTQVDADTVVITEDIEYGTPIGLTTSLMYPVLKQQFEARGPLYTKYFAKA